MGRVAQQMLPCAILNRLLLKEPPTLEVHLTAQASGFLMLHTLISKSAQHGARRGLHPVLRVWGILAGTFTLRGRDYLGREKEETQTPESE